MRSGRQWRPSGWTIDSPRRIPPWPRVSLWHDHDWAAAEREFQRTIALNPNSAYAHHWYALLLSYLGRRIEAIEHIQRAERLDPLAPQIANDHSWVLYLAREYDRAVEQAQKVLSYEPGFANAHRSLGFALIAGGRCEEGIVRLRRSFDLFGGEAFSDLKLAWGYARCGRADEARLLLSQALEAKGPGYLEPNAVAHVFVALGDHEHALTWLERAVEERAPYVADMAVEPALDPLRSDPRFVRLLKRLGLPIIPPHSSTRGPDRLQRLSVDSRDSPTASMKSQLQSTEFANLLRRIGSATEARGGAFGPPPLGRNARELARSAKVSVKREAPHSASFWTCPPSCTGLRVGMKR